MCLFGSGTDPVHSFSITVSTVDRPPKKFKKKGAHETRNSICDWLVYISLSTDASLLININRSIKRAPKMIGSN